MQNALSIERTHHPKGFTMATYHPETNMAYALNPKGVWISKMGQVLPPGKDPLGDDAFRGQRVWLLPEEALYLIERGTIDIRWPSMTQRGDQSGVPMSLQAAYAMFLGDEASHQGALTFERFSVYSALRRGGYTVIRAPSWNAFARQPHACHLPPDMLAPSRIGLLDILSRARSVFQSAQPEPEGGDNLIGRGFFRTYSAIYQRLALIDTFGSGQDAGMIDAIPIRVAYHVYKPSNSTFKKSAPGPPDFRLAVLDARQTNVPTLQQLSDLMATLPLEPPPDTSQFYAKLKHGYKNVVLAVVDQGVTSYLRFADAAFSKEKLYLPTTKGVGSKRGGKRGTRAKGR